MKRTLTLSLAGLFLSIFSIGYAQDKPSQRDQDQQGQNQQERNREAGSVTIRGCLAKAGQPQQYMVTDESSGENVTFSGPARLDDYVSQTVELTGDYVDNGGKKMFRPQSMKAVSSTCKAPGQGKQ